MPNKNSSNSSASVMIVTGEASGDIHGAHVVSEIKKILPGIKYYGVGGTNMRREGVEILTNVSELSVVGLVEVLRHYPRLRRLLKKTKNALKSKKPDLLILIDSPDFNLPLAKVSKQYGIKVLYYISPQIWAWRKSRIKQIQKYVDMMAVVFPFEEKFYLDAGVPVEYVGHPLIKEAKATIDKADFLTSNKLDPNKKLIGLFPGSRISEIEKNYPVLLSAGNDLFQQRQDIQFITPIAATLPDSLINKYISESGIEVSTTSENIYNVINACDVIAAASGTVTLQITLMQVPMLIVYKVSPTTYRIFKRIVKFTYAGIANVIAKKEISREFIQDNATTKNISSELLKLLTDKAYVSEMKKNMREIREDLGEKDGSATTAYLAAKFIRQSN
ncbi:MAG: lipid-A-disaccharide synthase [Gammaproteobacteria bacterium]